MNSTQATPLRDRILQAISENGSRGLGFADFMAICLYDPLFGYYSRPSERPIGRGGDFFTSVSVGPAYGFLLGWAIEARWQEDFGGETPFQVVEQGAHDGQLARDIVEGLRGRGSPLAEPGAMDYVLFEPDPLRRENLERRFSSGEGGGMIRVAAAVPEISAPAGLFLCNELLDAFPVHRIRRESGLWKELRVGAGIDGGFDWVTAPIEAGSLLDEEAARIEATGLPEGYTTEVCLEMEPWIRTAARWFHPQGLWWIIDYGHEADDFFAPSRSEGTLRAYRGHRLTDRYFEAVGETDLTSDVNFSQLERCAKAVGLIRRQYTDQHHFLIQAAEPWLREIESGGAEVLKENRQRLRQFQSLTHPGLMGRTFKVAEFVRGI